MSVEHAHASTLTGRCTPSMVRFHKLKSSDVDNVFNVFSMITCNMITADSGSLSMLRWNYRKHLIKSGQLVSWCFKLSQLQRIISGLRETFIKWYIVERTNKAEIRREEQTEKAELLGEFMEWNTVERAIKTEIDIRTVSKVLGKLSWFMHFDTMSKRQLFLKSLFLLPRFT